MNIKQIINNLSLIQMVFIGFFLFMLFGFIAGFIAGEYLQFKHSNNLINITANSESHLYRDNNIYYKIENFNKSLCLMNNYSCFQNITLINGDK